MYVLGLWGGANVDDTVAGGGHDACAALLKDGEFIAAIEEERICRVKHTRRPPIGSLAFCLEQAGITGQDVDLFAVGIGEDPSVRAMVREALSFLVGGEVPNEKLVFVDHHVAHAASAYAMSGFDESLVVTIDGMGDNLAGIIGVNRGGKLERLRDISIPNSLGHLYLRVIDHLGYRLFDEYKVMGLAPYGDPARFRPLLQELYTLQDEGRYTLSLERSSILQRSGPRRQRGEEFTQVHMDLAASLQEALETIVFHVLRHFQQKTGQRNLCLAGGVAHNCSMNGKLATSGLFERVFVQPAAHDAGTALGAALHAYLQANPGQKTRKLEHVYWGRSIPCADEVEQELKRWSKQVRIRRSDDVCQDAAKLLAKGSVIGWVQGRSEFGPRALGNRSILADPRPSENKDIINAMVKKREGYRPFAPSVLAERARDFFELPPTESEFPYMTFVVGVKESERAKLGAITHVDGTARIQTVSRDTNERYWKLIHAFGQETGVPMLLNTSFNNNWEPIVDTVRDAVVCFLTTKLHYLVVGDFIVEKLEPSSWSCLDLVPTQAAHVELRRSTKIDFGTPETKHTCHYEDSSDNIPDGMTVKLSEVAYKLLDQGDGERTVRQLLASFGGNVDEAELVRELTALWERRVVNLVPAGS